MTKFHQIQSLGKKAVKRLAQRITGQFIDLPTNYLKLCSIVYQAFKTGNSVALSAVTNAIELHSVSLECDRASLQFQFNNY